MTVRALDLSVDDVHIPGAIAAKPKKTTMADITTKQRKALPDSKFADPSSRAYPIQDKAHADNAMARLEQQKSSMSTAKYERIKGRIRAAQRRFGEQAKKAPKRSMRFRGAQHGFRFSVDHPTGGRIEYRHMKDAEPVRCPTVDVALLSDAAPEQPVWNQLGTPGRFFKDGSWFTLDAKVFADIIRNFNTSQNRQAPVDFEHATELPGSAGSIPMLGAPAQGWIRALEMRGQDLYGLIEWNDLGRQYIRAKQYKFLSPAIRFGCTDHKTGANIGARLTSAALTNVPYLDGMQQVAAKDAAMQTTEQEPVETQAAILKSAHAYGASEYMPAVRAALKLPELATAKMCSDHLGMLRAHFNDAGGDPNAAPMGIRLADYMMPMRDIVRPPMGATWDDVFDLMEDLIDQAMDEHLIRDHGVSPEEAANATATASDQTLDDEEMTMSDKELTVQLTEAKAQSIALAEKAKGYETEIASLTLRLKDSDGKVAEAATKMAQLEADIKTLKDASAKREEQLLAEKVEVAFETYKDAKSLTDANKKQMLLTLKSDAPLFDELYPAVDPSKRHLLKNISTTTSGRETTATKATASAPPDMQTLTLKYQKEGLSLDDAVSRAYVETKNALNSLGIG